MPDEIPLHEGRYHYRRAPVLVIGIVLLVICVPLFVHIVLAMVEALPKPDGPWPGLFPLAILGMFGWVGGWMLRAYHTNRVLQLSIDRRGICYDFRFFPWEEIKALRSRPRTHKGRWQLVLLRRSEFAWDRPLMTDDGLTDQELDALMATLQREIAPKFRHLRFVG